MEIELHDHAPRCSCAIRNLIARYTDAINIQDPQQLGDCFAEDAIWDIKNFAYAEGRAAIVEAVEEGRKALGWLIQYVNSTYVVSQTEDFAITRSYLIEWGPRDGVPTVFLGCYQDECIRDTDGVWRFKRRTFDMPYFGSPDMSAIPNLPFPNHYPQPAG